MRELVFFVNNAYALVVTNEGKRLLGADAASWGFDRWLENGGE